MSLRPFQGAGLLKRGQVQKHDLDIWRSQSKSAYQLRQLLIERGFHEPDAELPPLARADAPNHGRDRIGALEHLPRLLEKIAPRLRQSERPSAMQELHSELRLKLLNLPAQGRLRDVELVGRPAETTFSRDRHEIAQMSKLHSIPPGYQNRRNRSCPPTGVKAMFVGVNDMAA